MHRFDPRLMYRHAVHEAGREKIPIDMVALTYEDPDQVRSSDHDELREIRTRWFGALAVEVVVDVDNGMVVTVWLRGAKR